MRTKFFIYLLVINLVFVLSSCDSDSPTGNDNQTYDRGTVISSTKTSSFTPQTIETLMQQSGIITPFTYSYSVDVYDVVYQSVDAHENKIRLSGALMLPTGKDNPSLLSIQHGTETKSTSVASNHPLSSPEGMIGLISTSQGYLTLVPDYPGLGISEGIHPYIHAKSTSLSVIDFIRAGQNYCEENGITLNDKLFIGGYSEGGFATMATQREIESNYSSEFTLTASAPMACPSNLKWMSYFLLAKETYQVPMYLAFIMTAYDDIYGWNRLGEIFNSPYAENMKNYFNGSMSYGDINSALPTKITDLFKTTFVTSFLAGNETVIDAALDENTLLGWDPVAPMRMYHGDADTTVFYQNSVDALNDFNSRGATNVELITIPGGTHATSGLEAYIGMMNWFNSF